MMGPSGAGKTTLLNRIVGRPIAAGQIVRQRSWMVLIGIIGGMMRDAYGVHMGCIKTPTQHCKHGEPPECERFIGLVKGLGEGRKTAIHVTGHTLFKKGRVAHPDFIKALSYTTAFASRLLLVSTQSAAVPRQEPLRVAFSMMALPWERSEAMLDTSLRMTSCTKLVSLLGPLGPFSSFSFVLKMWGTSVCRPMLVCIEKLVSKLRSFLPVEQSW